MTGPYQSVLVRAICTLLIPAIQIFAIYVLTQGHYSPGGGFQGGGFLAASVILARVAFGTEISQRAFSSTLAAALAAVGMLVFMLAALLPMVTGGLFLDYVAMPIPGLSDADLRYYGILLAELGITLGVFGTLVVIFDSLVGEKD